MQTTVGELAVMVNGVVTGDPGIVITSAQPLHLAQQGSITLMDRSGADRLSALAMCPASAVVVPQDLEIPDHTCIHVEHVHKAFIKIAEFFRPLVVHRKQRVISPMAVIDPTAKIGQNVAIDPFVTIGENVVIGDNCTLFSGVHILCESTIGEGTTLFPNVTIYEHVTIGRRCILHAGVVVGAYGFGYIMEDGRHVLAGQSGGVIIGDDVDLGANTTVDRGTYGPTMIGDGTKMDDHVMIGHNGQIGRHNLLCSQVGVAGSTRTGDYVIMGGQVGVRDHVRIGNRAMLGAQCGVMNDIPDDTKVLGSPAIPEREQLLLFAATHKLPELRRNLKRLERTITELESRLERRDTHQE